MKRVMAVVAAPMVGITVFLTGLFYDVMFAGIPYQDPTPELAAEYAARSSDANILYSAGAFLLVAGILAAPFIWRRMGAGSREEVPQ